MKILNSTVNDLEDIYLIDKQIYGSGCYPRFVIRQFFDCFGNNFKIAKKDGKTIGFSINGIENESNLGWVLSLAVDIRHRNCGVGSKLLKETIIEFKKKNIEKIKLTVHPNNVACKLYKKFGFKKEKQFDSYYGDHEERILMVLKLV